MRLEDSRVRMALAAVVVAAVLGAAAIVVAGRGGDQADGPPTGPVGTPGEEQERDPEPAPTETEPEEPPDPEALLVVGDAELTEAEEQLETLLRDLGFAIEVLDDEGSSAEDAEDRDVVLISKSVESEEIADTFLETPAGVVFWEDNAQAIEQGGEDEGETGTGTPGLATADLVNPEDTSWHGEETDVYVNPEAPEHLRAGLSGEVTLYRQPAEMTFAPTDDGEPTAADSAVWVAELAHEGNGRYVYYVIEADAGLADGTDSHGRRVYFGLYDETFSLLTPDGRALFEAAVRWAAGMEAETTR